MGYLSILAEIGSTLDISSAWCLCLIIVIIIILFIFAKAGPFGGSSICLTIGFLFLLINNDSPQYVSNLSHTKWFKKAVFSAEIQESDCIYSSEANSFIPAEEIQLDNGRFVMKDGRDPKFYFMADPDRMPDNWKNMDWSDPKKVVYDKYGENYMVTDYLLYKNDDGIIVKLDTNKPPTDDDFYCVAYDQFYSSINVPTKAGGSGCDSWIFNPTVMTWPFLIAGAPVLLGGIVIMGKKS